MLVGVSPRSTRRWSSRGTARRMATTSGTTEARSRSSGATCSRTRCRAAPCLSTRRVAQRVHRHAPQRPARRRARRHAQRRRRLVPPLQRQQSHLPKPGQNLPPRALETRTSFSAQASAWQATMVQTSIFRKTRPSRSLATGPCWTQAERAASFIYAPGHRSRWNRPRCRMGM